MALSLSSGRRRSSNLSPSGLRRSVRLYPERLAIKARGYSLSYEALNRAANRIANAVLRDQGEKDEPVTLLFGKREALTAAIFGVLKTGRIYVVLNPSFPPSRVRFMLKDSQAGLIVTDSDHLSVATRFAQEGLRLINVGELDPGLAAENPAIPISPAALTWINYTSGSTGQPKGVVQNHLNVLHLIMTQTNDLHICSRDRLAVLTSAGGDMFLALLNGAAIFPANIKEEGLAGLGNWLIQEKISVYSSVPSVFRHFVNSLRGDETFPELRLIRFTGEPVHRSDVELYRKHFSADCILVNRLSSSEVPTFRQYLVNHSTGIAENLVPVGYATEDKEVFLLGEDGKEVGSNEIGEITVKSRHLSPGYWRNPDLTRAEFSPAPDEEEKRVFRTGDLGRVSPDGCLVYVGRKDFQVKIRGHRVELAEIERALLSLGKFREVVVLSSEDHPGERRLVAYLVPVSQPAMTVSALRASLSEKLPEYMIPSGFVLMDSLPLTANGKIDRRTLPDPGNSRPELEMPFVAPRTPIETELAKIWSEVLSLRKVGVCDNFFDLGGHSLGATQVIFQVIRKFQVELPLQSLFAAPTVAQMAAIVIEHQGKKLGEAEMEAILTKLESLTDEEARRLLKKSDEQH